MVRMAVVIEGSPRRGLGATAVDLTADREWEGPDAG